MLPATTHPHEVRIVSQATFQEALAGFLHIALGPARLAWSILIALAALVVLTGSLELALNGRVDFHTDPLFWTMCGAVIVGTPALTAGLAYAAVRRAWNTDPRVRSPATVTFTPEGAHAAHPGTETRLTWASLHRVDETTRLLIQFQSRELAIIVPKRAFEDPDDLARVREFIRAALGPRARLR